MKRQPYRLEPLVTLKRKAKDRAELALARALGRLETEKTKLKKLEEEKQEIIRRKRETRQELHLKVSTGKATVKEGTSRIHFLQKLEEDQKQKEFQIDQQQKTIADCEVQVKRARRDYLDAVKELRIMEKHKAMWQKRRDRELRLEEEKEMDELSNVIHQLKRMESYVGRSDYQ